MNPFSIGDIDLVRALIENGTGVNSLDDAYINTALHRVADKGHRDVAELLIAKGADVNAKDNSGETALSVAREKSHFEIVELLKKHGAKE